MRPAARAGLAGEQCELAPSAWRTGANIEAKLLIFRRHMIIEDVGVRDSAFYSITDLEWPDVRANLQRRIAAAQARQGVPVQ